MNKHQARKLKEEAMMSEAEASVRLSEEGAHSVRVNGMNKDKLIEYIETFVKAKGLEVSEDVMGFYVGDWAIFMETVREMLE